LTYLLAAASVLFFLDQWSKWMAQERLLNRCFSCGVFDLRYTTHVRRRFLQAKARAILAVLWLVSLGAAMILRHSGEWFQSSPAMIGLGLAFGGAAANLVDILLRRHIVNLLDFRWWPVFNLADVGIVGGLALAFCS
jgi:signal peptidase II